MNISETKTVYFIGIGGIGISAIARMFVLQGKQVSGSDRAESEVTKLLQELGITIHIGEAEKGRTPEGCELVVYTRSIDEENEELVEAKKRGIPILSYPEALGLVSKDMYTIAVVGTHGKTTTTAMVAKILMDAGLDPTVIVGSLITGHDGKKTNFISGKSKYFVVEGCEYKRSFLNLNPNILVVTNIEADHLDYYKDIEDIQNAFLELERKIPQDGFLLVNAHSPNCDVLVRNSRSQNGDWGTLALPEGFVLKVPGKHNIQNARAALAVAKALKLSEEKALTSLAEFSGTWRRFEYRGELGNGTLVYDDYAHHPTEISASLQGAREKFPDKKIVVVFQPHLYSRTKDLLSGFGESLSKADYVVMLPIYPAREEDPGNINSGMVVEEIIKYAGQAELVATFDEAAKRAEGFAGAEGLIITMGAGETNKVADIFVQ